MTSAGGIETRNACSQSALMSFSIKPFDTEKLPGNDASNGAALAGYCLNCLHQSY